MDNLVLSNMTHRPARTFVSILGVAVGVLLIVFTVGLAHGVLRERGRRESEVGAEIMVRASGTSGLSGTQRFAMPVTRAAEVVHDDLGALGADLTEIFAGGGFRHLASLCTLADRKRLRGPIGPAELGLT